jgi:hypothetical protein
MTKKGGKKKLRGQLFWNRIELFNTSSIPLLITLLCNICKMDVIPLVFSPHSVNAEVNFKDLSKHSFTAKEKLWMHQYMGTKELFPIQQYPRQFTPLQVVTRLWNTLVLV